MAEKRVFIIDDEDDIRTLVARRLKKKGYEVDTAGSAVEIAVRLKAFNPDVLLVDLYMPEVSGMALIQQIRNAESGFEASDSKLKIIAMSGGADLDWQEELINLNIPTVSKPLNFEQLLEQINN